MPSLPPTYGRVRRAAVLSNPARPGAEGGAVRFREDNSQERLLAFRAAHPGVIIGPGEFGTWQALISEENGETVVNRHRLCELLDRLDELTRQHCDQPD